MSATPPVIRKIPGKPPKFEHEKDGYVDLSRISKTELLDLFDREKKILNNRKFLEKLPDKGKKIENFYNKLKEELEKRDENEKLCQLLTNLSVQESQKSLNKLEWTGDSNLRRENPSGSNTENDMNPFSILVNHSGTSVSTKKLPDESAPLKNPIDAEKQSENDLFELYAEHLCDRIDKTETQPKKFYPGRSLNKTFSSNTSTEKEISAAYVPRSISGQTKLITLREAVSITKKQAEHLAACDIRQAVDKLSQKSKVRMKMPKIDFGIFRDPNEDSEEDELSSEISDDEDHSNLSDVD